MNCSLPGSPVPGILQARTLEWVAISFSNAGKRKVKVKSLSLVRLLATPWTAAHQAPPAMGFSRQEYWSGVPLPSPHSPSSQGYSFSSSHVWMWELDCEESWALKNWCFWTVLLEKTLESPLDCKEIQPVHSKGDQSWVFIGRTDVEAETPILRLPDGKSWLIWKDPNAGQDWGQEEKGTTEDEMAGWHHQVNGHGFGSTPRVGVGQGGLAGCGHGVTWGQTLLSDWNELKWRTIWKVTLEQQQINMADNSLQLSMTLITSNKRTV